MSGGWIIRLNNGFDFLTYSKQLLITLCTIKTVQPVKFMFLCFFSCDIIKFNHYLFYYQGFFCKKYSFNSSWHAILGLLRYEYEYHQS